MVAAASRTNENIAFLHIDLDGFKGINDQLGHKTGDLVLQEVADRLIRAVGPSDVVARLGGDEFAVMLRPPSNIADAKVVANSIRELFNEPMMIETLPLVVGGSIGISVYPEHGEDVDALLNNADAAMYRAKTTHTGSAETFDVSTDRFRPARFRLVGEVTRAIANNELELRYQPKMDLTAGTIIGVEALLRWRHPSLGLLNPDAFMHTTEQTELMHDLTKYVIREALEQTSRWHDEGWLLSVAVNVSARNLHDRRFPDVVETLLTNANVNGGWLELEITENSVMTDPERSARVLARLRELGVQISIDDFGTGYSSLARLRTLPVDRVKIDRSFVTSMATTPQDASIVQSIIQLASNLGLGTIAEGVETPEVLAMLQELGCQVAQGFLIGEPVPASELPNLIERMQEQRFGITQRGDTR